MKYIVKNTTLNPKIKMSNTIDIFNIPFMGTTSFFNLKSFFFPLSIFKSLPSRVLWHNHLKKLQLFSNIHTIHICNYMKNTHLLEKTLHPLVFSEHISKYPTILVVWRCVEILWHLNINFETEECLRRWMLKKTNF